MGDLLQNDPMWDAPRENVINANDEENLTGNPYPYVEQPHLLDLFSSSLSTFTNMVTFANSSLLSAYRRNMFVMPNGMVAVFAVSAGICRAIDPINAVNAGASSFSFDATSAIAIVVQFNKNKYKFLVVMTDGQVWLVKFNRAGIPSATSVAANILGGASSGLGAAFYTSSLAAWMTGDDKSIVFVNTSGTRVYAGLYAVTAGNVFAISEVNSGVISGAASATGAASSYAFIDKANSIGDLHGVVSVGTGGNPEERAFHISFDDTSITLNAFDYVSVSGNFLNEYTRYHTTGANAMERFSTSDSGGTSRHSFDTISRNGGGFTRAQIQQMSNTVLSADTQSTNYLKGETEVVYFHNCPLFFLKGSKNFMCGGAIHKETSLGSVYGSGAIRQGYAISESCMLLMILDSGDIAYRIVKID